MSVDIPLPPPILVTSPFHPDHYPNPWPFTPFEHDTTVLLQERIPLHLLPQTLYVHDPFCLLPAVERRLDNTSWKSRPDVIRTYTLQLSESVRLQAECTRRKEEVLEEFKARTKILLRYRRTKEQIKNFEPEIEVSLPRYVRRPTKICESHMYLSPVAKVGEGHHSLVYKTEWELPRNLFVKETICQFCFKESMDQEIRTLKDTGKWDKLLKAAGWGPNGFTGYKPTQEEVDELNVLDPVDPERDGEIFKREIVCVVPPGLPPARVVESLDNMKIWDKFEKGTGRLHLEIEMQADENDSTTGSPGIGIRITPPFSESCRHGRAGGPVPRTAMFTVVAKLSIEDDPHLEKEAKNYQDFPEHFFHHYDGYTIIPQLRTIAPVHAVVPQFYGYYTPDTSVGTWLGHPRYLSPVMLLEHCGEPMVPEELTLDEQEECTSLLLRFQRAGWLHESVAPRNFLVQYGKPTEFPLTRTAKPEPSFRLIDFGRSRKYETAAEKRSEESEVLKMFSELEAQAQMAVTFGLG